MVTRWLSAICVVLGCVVATGALAQAPMRQHLTIDHPGKLDPAQANEIYDDIAAELADMYALSQEPATHGYQRWVRHNIAPYLSATHGNRYINNFANRLAADYAKVAGGDGRLPPGAVIAKDSFTVTAEGEVFGAALFIMEKLAAGASPATADWRYAMILPDGSYDADSQGDTPESAAYCHHCHKAKAKADYLFFVPRAYRRE
ncbi:MAG: cytochrome P460 family protein [Alphaproteobacteria bacterium]